MTWEKVSYTDSNCMVKPVNELSPAEMFEIIELTGASSPVQLCRHVPM